MMRDLQSRTSAAKERYLALFKASRQQERGPVWLRRRRSEAIEHFERLGFPTTRDEEWKYTDITPVANLVTTPIFDGNLSAPAPAGIEAFLLGDVECSQLVFINGRYSPQFSSVKFVPQGGTIGSLADAIANNSEVVQEHLTHYADAETDVFTALNTAFFEDGAFIHIPNGTVVEASIHLLFVATSGDAATTSHMRNLIIAGANCQVKIVESYVCPGNDVYFSNSVTEVVAGAGANVDHYKVQLESEHAFHIGSMQVQANTDSKFSSHSFAFGGRIARNNASAVMGGQGIESTLNGLYLTHGEQVIDNHTVMDHAEPNCASHELYAGILSGKSRGVFNGKIFVRPDAQKTDAKQSNRSLLLSREAEIDTKPQLEIYADDVKCTHGATIGELDEDALFYLRARGIPKNEARDMLVHAFANDVLERVKVEALRRQLEEELLVRLAQTR